MLKHLFTYLLITISLTTFAQTSLEKELDSITTFEKAKAFIDSHDFKKNKFIVFNEEKHKTTLAKELFMMSLGGTKSFENGYEKTVYKILDKTKITNYRASYIFIDGSKVAKADIETLRQTIIRKYYDGASFNFLAKQYSMDSNANRGGDTGWFSENFLDPDLESILVSDNHAVNDIFTAQVPSKNKYYVILKTYKPKAISEIKVLKIVEDIE